MHSPRQTPSDPIIVNCIGISVINSNVVLFQHYFSFNRDLCYIYNFNSTGEPKSQLQRQLFPCYFKLVLCTCLRHHNPILLFNSIDFEL